MKIYRVKKYHEVEGSRVFSYHSSLVKAKKAMAEYKRSCTASGKEFEDSEEPENMFDDYMSEIEVLEYPISAKGLILALNENGSHNDNG